MTAAPKGMRTLSGLVVPWGVPGTTSLGRVTYAAGSISWGDPSRVKLLIEHDPNRIIGHGAAFEERPEGLHGTFLVDDTPEALAALASAFRMVRDGLSGGVEFVDNVRQALARNPAVPAGTPAQGTLREVSLVAIPAFDDSRVDDVELDAKNLPAAAAAGPTLITSRSNAMSHIATARGRGALATASAPVGLATASTDPTPPAAPTDPAAPAPAAPATAAAGQAAQTPPAAAATAQAAGVPLEPAAARPIAQAGAYWTAHDAATYTFDGLGEHSLIRDLVTARQDDDAEAAARVRAFHQALADPRSAQTAMFANAAVQALATAAVAVRGAGIGSDNITPDNYRPDLIVRALNAGTPILDLVRNLPISGPNPFRVPTFGRFVGVGVHTEGTSHVAEGTVDQVGGQTITPHAVSGAWRGSRELIESTGPNIDRLVLEEMLVDYREVREAALVAKLEEVRPAVQVGGIDTGAELLAQLPVFLRTRRRPPSVIAFGDTAFGTFATLTAADGRPYFPHLGPSNAAGTTAVGLASMSVQGVPGVPAWSVDATDAWMLYRDDVVSYDSSPRLFRFEEVEGPGIIKLALWGYQAVHVFRAEGVRRLATV